MLGLDWSFIGNVIPLFAKALWLTLHLSFWVVILSIIVGFFVATIEYYKVRGFCVF